MSFFNFNGKNIYYDVQGEGKPILLLNGIMMSTRSWEPFVKSLTANNKLIRVDFIDQGQSDKADSQYTQDTQVEIASELLKHLSLDKVNVTGISYGGEIAMKFAIKYPEKVDRLLLINTTPYTSKTLKETGDLWNAIGDTRNASMYYKVAIPVIYSPSFYEKNLEWMKNRERVLEPVFSNPVFLDSIKRLTISAENHDVRDQLKNIKAPTLIVGSDEDYLTPLSNQKTLSDLIPNSNFVVLPGVGHASMYEKPLLFTSLVLGFINTVDAEYKI